MPDFHAKFYFVQFLSAYFLIWEIVNFKCDVWTLKRKWILYDCVSELCL